MGFSIAWLRDEPGREGEVAFFDEEDGAGVVGGPDEGRRAVFVRQRPARSESTPPLASPEAFLLVRARGAALEIAPAPGHSLRVDGSEVASARVDPGAVVSVPHHAVLVAVRRPALLPVVRSVRVEHAFGEPDAFGWAGESAEAWRLRDTIALAARSPAHVLVEGPSGAGKGIAARALHALSPRAAEPLVVCSDGALAAAEELLARAAGGTLIVDPAEALTPDAQARLLHFARTQRIESLAGELPMQVRLIVLARRLEGAFGNELRSRFLSLVLPGVSSRREDVPLILRARALAVADRTPELGASFVVTNLGGRRAVRIDGELVEAVLLRSWTAGGFEVDRLLWRAMTTSDGNALALTEAAAQSMRVHPAAAVSPPAPASGTIRDRAERLGIPRARHWGEVRVRPVDGLTVLVTVGARSARFSHVDLGLASVKSRGPTRAWELLLATCEGRGTFAWRQFGETRDTVRKQVERLGEALCAAVGLEEAPFEPFDTNRGWVARFLAVPER
jgi:two-component system nitrogen regulation response regulator GlnG/two-component system response regulator HydG